MKTKKSIKQISTEATTVATPLATTLTTTIISDSENDSTALFTTAWVCDARTFFLIPKINVFLRHRQPKIKIPAQHLSEVLSLVLFQLP